MPDVNAVAKITTKQRIALAAKINKALGSAALRRLYNALSSDEYNQLADLFEAGRVGMHNDGYRGVTIDTDKGWTNECYHAEQVCNAPEVFDALQAAYSSLQEISGIYERLEDEPETAVGEKLFAAATDAKVAAFSCQQLIALAANQFVNDTKLKMKDDDRPEVVVF